MRGFYGRLQRRRPEQGRRRRWPERGNSDLKCEANSEILFYFIASFLYFNNKFVCDYRFKSGI